MWGRRAASHSLSVRIGFLVALDNLSKSVRSRVMASIRSKDTAPELTVRRLLWARGSRFRVHDRSVIGAPDISNKARKVAVFVDGCFWHGCGKCYKEPTTNVAFWREKVRRNQKRRLTVRTDLRERGWKVLEIWEHSVNSSPTKVVDRIRRSMLAN
jgi:DNA mismatch endonuclease (patch repair protein)